MGYEIMWVSEMLGFFGSETLDGFLMGYDVMYSSGWLQVFGRNMLPLKCICNP